MIAATFWVLAGLAMVVAGARLDIGTLARPGPGFLPIVAGALLGVLGSAVAVSEWRAGRARLVMPALPGGLWAVATTVLVLIAYAALLPRLGFVLTTLLLLGFLFRGVGGLGWPLALGLTAGATTLSYVLFSVWLKVPFPSGPWSP